MHVYNVLPLFYFVCCVCTVNAHPRKGSFRRLRKHITECMCTFHKVFYINYYTYNTRQQLRVKATTHSVTYMRSLRYVHYCATSQVPFLCRQYQEQCKQSRQITPTVKNITCNVSALLHGCSTAYSSYELRLKFNKAKVNADIYLTNMYYVVFLYVVSSILC